MVWQFQWPEYIPAKLVIFGSPKGAVTNSNLDMVTLVLQELVFPHIIRDPACLTPTSGSDNPPTVYWAFSDAATINPAVADLLSIRS